MIRFGISGLPPAEGSARATADADAAFLDALAERGHRAFELAFVKGFPWKEDRCRRFGEQAAARDIRLSIHAPYFAVLTVQDDERAARCVSAIEHTMKLAAAMRAPVVVVHPGPSHGLDGETLHALAAERIGRIEAKVAPLGVGLGLETAGKTSAFGSLGDIAILARTFPFVRPVVDWAHLHAVSGGALTSTAAFEAVIAFLREEFPGWMLDPLHTQFTASAFGPSGEIKHVPYGTTELRVGPLVEAAASVGLRMTIISEAREAASHDAIQAEIEETLDRVTRSRPQGRPLASGAIDFPDPVIVVPADDGFVPLGFLNPLRLRNLDKVFFPQDGYTKGDLIQYYASIGPTLLPHLADRPIVMARYPDGAEGASFYEKQAPPHTPAWIERITVPSEHRGRPIDYVTAGSVEALMWLANMGCIEIHPWLSRADHLDRPDAAVFDLDPAEDATWEQVVTVAELLRQALTGLGLRSYPKTSGATGMHVYVPLEPIYPYERVRGFVDTVARLLLAADPDDVTLEWDIARRAGKVFIDVNQNVGGKTIASVYSVRPRPGAPVSAPLRWDEVGEVRAGDLTMATIWDRLREVGDLFLPVLADRQRLEDAERALGIAREPADPLKAEPAELDG